MLFTGIVVLSVLCASALTAHVNHDCDGLHRLKLSRRQHVDVSSLQEGRDVGFNLRYELEALANKYGGASKIGLAGESSLPFDKALNVQTIFGDDEGGGYRAPFQSK